MATASPLSMTHSQSDKSQVIPKIVMEVEYDNMAYTTDESIEQIPIQIEGIEEDVSASPLGPTEDYRSEEPGESWNKIKRSPNRNGGHSEARDWRCLYVISRVAVCFIFFCVVLVMATASQLCLMLLTSHVHVSADSDLVFRKARGENTTLKKDIILETDVAWIWSLVIVICLPYGLTILGSVWKIFTMKTDPIDFKIVVLAALPETAHTAGLSLFVFYTLPSFDPITGMFLIFCVGTLPGILQIYRPVPNSFKKMRFFNLLLLLVHLGILAYFSYQVYVVRQSVQLTVILPLSLLLISASWWDNFVKKSPHVNCNDNKSFWGDLKFNIGKQGPKIYLLLSIWKILLTISLVILLFSHSNTHCLRTLTGLDNHASSCLFDRNVNLINNSILTQSSMIPLKITCISIFSGAICYKTVKYSCKILAQQLCFATAVTVSFLLTLTLLGYLLVNAEMLNTWLDFPLVPRFFLSDVALFSLVRSQITIYRLPLLSLSVLYLTFGVGLHIWIPRNEKLTRTQWLFQKPLYCGVLLVPSLILNRSREEQWKEEPSSEPSRRTVPMIHICATMWQEGRKEMLQLVKSIFRLDKAEVDSKAVKVFNVIPYNFDAHIFFDNAFDDNGVNMYVKRLDEAIQEAAKDVFETDDLVHPSKVRTPYGGRLVWTLPNDHTLTVHLKDSRLIRRKKRWSQVMFMYYFLMRGILDNKDILPDQKNNAASNTFILTLDADVGFQPEALQTLVVRMNSNPFIGAVCGRIHPLGAGPMVWYQKFEYAISHWLQKATENTLGCVLCSPGCFSLFRGSALMDDNVLASYTEPVTEALQKIQFDLGEDRWLCTLLLQQGHRVEYTAASDSYTFAPEGFSEFFKQRRRWAPSTMANIYDLIMSWRTTVAYNPDISLFYIIYQLGLFVSSIVTPGTIFMLVVGALSSAFPDLSLFMSLMINLVPLIIFVILCLKTNQDTQLVFAQVLTLCYCLLMTVVLVGIIKQAAESGFCSVSTLFLTGITGIFIISALLHPQEMLLLLYGPLYFLLIPCTSMLMIIFAIANINDESWGTRDSGKTNAKILTNRMNKVKEGFTSCFAWCMRNEVTDDTCEMQPLVNSEEQDRDCINTQTPRAMVQDDIHLQTYLFDEKLPNDEERFWQTLINRLLSPLDITEEKKAEQKKITTDLRQLRDNVFLGFVLINAVFIILLFSLESIAQYTPNLAFELPCPGVKFKAEKVQPIAVAFTLVFGVLLFIQFIAMLFHRFSTLLQIVVSRPAMLEGCYRSNTKTEDVLDSDIRDLVRDYISKNTKPVEVNTDDERRGDRRRREIMREIKQDVPVSNLWLDIDQLTTEYYKEETKINLQQKIKTKFNKLSHTSRNTIAKLVNTTYKNIKQDRELNAFETHIKTECESQNDGEREKTIEWMFEGQRHKGRMRTRPSIVKAFPQGNNDEEEGWIV